MAKQGKYCKAYYLRDLRKFAGWSEASENAKKVTQEVDGVETEVVRPLTDKDYLFLQEDFTVTDSIFLDENVIFNQVTPEWEQFCKETLKFEVPNYETAKAAEK